MKQNVKKGSIAGTAGVMSFLVEDIGKRWDLRYFTSKGLLVVGRMCSPLVAFQMAGPARKACFT